MPTGPSASRRASGARRVLAIAAACAAGVAVTAPSPATAAPGDDPVAIGTQLAGRVTLAGVNRHLIAFQRIANLTGGTRAAGSPGYDASVDYVAGKLRDAGFEVTTPSFSFVLEEVHEASTTVGGTPIEAQRMEYSASSPAGGVTGPLAIVPVDDTTGCEADDYAGGTYAGTIAVIRRGGCTFAQKQAMAAGAGAVGAIIVNNVGGPLAGTIGSPDDGVIPTVGVTPEVGLTLTAGTTATIVSVATFTPSTSRNVIAQTRTGRPDNVVMIGSHLDSVPEGPGINDNGTGAAAVLETALRLGSSPDLDNAVRFGFWGAEESGLIGSTAYVDSLSFEETVDLALYLNVDMIGSPNAGYFVYDGDDSDETGSGPGPIGSAEIERTLVTYLVGTKKVFTGGTDFDGRSDYRAFMLAGIPAGGLFTGAEQPKGELAAALWGGQVGVAYDPCYHQACDTLNNVDRVALERNADALAFATGLYAASTEAVNGVPPREERAQAQAFSAFAAEDTPAYRGHRAVS